MARKKKQSTGFAIWFLLIGFPIVFFLLLQQFGVFRWVSGLLSGGSKGDGKNAIAADVSKDDFDEFSEALGVERAIRLTIVGLDEEYEIRHTYDDRRGEATFRVIPKPDSSGVFPAFSAEVVRGFVSRGLHCYDPEGKELGPERRLFRKWDVQLTGDSRTPGWSVHLSGIRPAGSIELRLGRNATDRFDVALPPIGSLSGLWNGRIAFNSDKGTVRINSYVLAPARSGTKEPGVYTEFKPNPDLNMPGFRVLYVTSGCIWLEVVYATPSDVLLSARERWPGIEIAYQVFDDGSSHKVVRFEGGYVSPEDKAIIFREGDRLNLKKGNILAQNAVRFEYKSSDGKTSADLLVITPRR